MSCVISVRVPRELKRRLEELGIDYAREVREYLEKRVREVLARRLLREFRELNRRIRVEGNLAVEFVREDRDRG